MFTMTFDYPEKGVVVHGRSLDGETWERTFLRLYQAALVPGSAPRRIVHTERRGPPSGACTNTLITAYNDRAGQLVLDLPVLVRTCPAQF